MSKRIGGIVGSIALTSLLAVSVAPHMAQARTAQAGATVTIGVSVPLLQLPALAKGISNGVAVAVALLAPSREPSASYHELRADYGELPAARVPKF